MSVRRILSVLSQAWVLAVALLLLSPTVFHAAPQDSGYRVLRAIHLGGEGGWDYVTVDSAARRVYIPRSTHIMVIDADSGKLVGDIQGMNGLHGVAVVSLLKSHDGHERRDVLPDAADVGDPAVVEIGPDAAGTKRQSTVMPRRLERRRPQQDRIIPIVNGLDLHHGQRAPL